MGEILAILIGIIVGIEVHAYPKDKKIIVPIIYHPSFEFSLPSKLKARHPFSNKQYSLAASYLVDEDVVPADSWTLPERITLEDLSLVHSVGYLEKLKTPQGIFEAFEWPRRASDSEKARKETADAILLAEMAGAGGTWKAAEMALTHSWSINLGGGYHHAFADHGSGFCILADAPLAIMKVLSAHPGLKVLIVDLDAHHGDGNASFFASEERVRVFDMYTRANKFPGSILELKKIGGVEYRIELRGGTMDTEYLKALTEALPIAVDTYHPDLIYYNAGTDIYENDPLGSMKISSEGIIQRDQFVFGVAKSRSIPIFMALSGGYATGKNLPRGATDVFTVIGHSIKRLFDSGLISLPKV